MHKGVLKKHELLNENIDDLSHLTDKRTCIREQK